MKIKKISQPLKVEGDIIDSLSSASRENAPSIHAVYRGVYGYELYNNANGTNGDVELSDNISNYKYLEVHYHSYSTHTSRKIEALNGYNMSLDLYTFDVGSDYLGQYQRYSNYQMVDNMLKFIGSYSVVKYSNSDVENYDLNQEIYIDKVIGYK